MTQKGYNVPGWTCDKLPHSCQQDEVHEQVHVAFCPESKLNGS